MTDWQSINTAPDGEPVLTKIDDGRGVRNEQPMKRQGRLWWFVDGSMYVYYTPTHWKPLPESGRGRTPERQSCGMERLTFSCTLVAELLALLASTQQELQIAVVASAQNGERWSVAVKRAEAAEQEIQHLKAEREERER